MNRKKTFLTELQKVKIDLDYQFIQPFENILEIPADIILYNIFKVVGFDKIITDEEVRNYTKSLNAACAQNAKNLPQCYGINYPSKYNYHDGLFEEVVFEDNESGFKMCCAKTRIEKELREYCFTRLELFIKSEGEILEKVIATANQKFQRIINLYPSTRYQEINEDKRVKKKKKVLLIPQILKSKLKTQES